MYDPNAHHEVVVQTPQGEVLARFADTSDATRINLFWNDDLAELDQDELSPESLDAVICAVGLKALAIDSEAAPPKPLTVQ